MFTGIVECLGRVESVTPQNGNIRFSITAPFVAELKVDQSVAHNGVCLTVTEINGPIYSVTAIEETLNRTSLSQLKPGDEVNLERCLSFNGRLDGHLVQGHVDLTATCVLANEQNGSWKFGFEYDRSSGHITVEKGSVCVNGVSLTVVDSEPGYFSVAIIPFTFEHTTFKSLKKGDKVNIEFDIIGKYVARYMAQTTK